MSDIEEPGQDTAAHLAKPIPVCAPCPKARCSTPQLGTTSGAAGGLKRKEINIKFSTGAVLQGFSAH